MKELSRVLLAGILLSALFVACDKEIEEEIRPTPPAEEGIYILNRGNYNASNASIGLYNLITKELTPDIYKAANGGSLLGESAEQLIVYGSKLYVTVTFSNRIAVLDLSGKLIKSISPVNAKEEPMQPRCMAAHEGKVYISYYAGHSVAVLDTTSLEMQSEVGVGRYPEQVAVGNGKLYVANSGGGDYPDYGKTISVINLSTLKVEKEIEVIINPKAVVIDKEGDIFVISLGNYGDIDETLQRIDSKTGAVSTLGKASKMSWVNNTLYTVYAPYGNPNIAYKKYDTQAEAYIDGSFIKDETTITSLSSLNVSPSSGKIYMADFRYGSTSTMYIFTAQGTLEGTPFDTGGYDTQGVCFYSK